ncbi:MAG: SPOR domain-containing protein [Gammaproteobacteria bacterium]|nr:SPOR domain-containing protein [Gammaproteobacteria bacterium]
MVTFQAGRVVLLALVAGMTAACSREQQDWRSAESADTPESWQRFLEQHPESELINEARNRIVQLEVHRDFQHADHAGTVEAYRAFLAHHPSGIWSERARIRIESFSLGSAPRIAPPTPEEVASFGDSGVRALHLATAAVPLAEPPPAVAPAPADVSADSPPIQPAALPLTAPESAVAAPPETASAGTAPAEAARPESAAGRAVPGEAAEAAADAAVATQTGYGIQLGAFGSEASADREWRRLQVRFGAELGTLSPRIVTAESESRQLYRLQVAAAGEAQARALCDSLREQAQACIPVVPQ